jgi:hypothetical protein
MRVFIAVSLAVCLSSGCASEHRQSTKASGGEGTGESIALGVGLAPFVVATSPLWLAGWGVRCVSEIGDPVIYIPEGKTKEEVEREIASIPSPRSSKSMHFRHGDEFWRVAKGGKIFYARFHDGTTVEYGK